MDVFVINLDRSRDRLAHMNAACAGVPFTRVPAVDGCTLSDAEQRRLTSRRARLSAGEIGCFLSHRTCWHRLVVSGAKAAIVLEDDVYFGAGFAELASSSDWIPAGADVVKLDARPNHRVAVDRGEIPVGARTLARMRSINLGAGAYVVRRRTAERLLAASDKLDGPVDNFLFDPSSPMWAGLATYQLIPAICLQDVYLGGGLPSTLEAARSLRKATAWRKVFRELWRPIEQCRTAVQTRWPGRKRIEVPFR